MIFKKGKKQAGSTIVEFMTVMFIIAGISTMIIPNVYAAIHKAKLSACISNVRNIVSSLEQYKNENEKYPPTLLHLVPRYLAMIPECPEPRKDTYSDGYKVSDDGLNFTLLCRGENHVTAGLKPNQPFFNYSQGGLKAEKE